MKVRLIKGTNEYHLRTYDPGAAASGWSHFCVDFRAFSRPENKVLSNIKWYEHGEHTGSDHAQYRKAVDQISNTTSDYGDGASYLFFDVVSEDFELTQLIGSTDNLLSPVRFNAVMEWECRKRSVKFHLQGRQMRTGITRERLKLLGFGTGYRKDEFAAMQHALTWLRRLKNESRKRPWKLSDEGIINARWDCACERRGKRCDMLHPRTR